MRPSSIASTSSTKKIAWGLPTLTTPGECMTGFEYQAAVLLMDYGFKDEGLEVAAAVRDRHAGHNRNPFNEPECGSYYARAMAAWALLDAWEKEPLGAD